MSKFDELITAAEGAGINERKQFVHFMLNTIQQTRGRLDSEDKEALLNFAYGQVEEFLKAIPEAKCYKEKDQLFEVEDMVLGMIMGL